jgi:hypothetical protein
MPKEPGSDSQTNNSSEMMDKNNISSSERGGEIDANQKKTSESLSQGGSAEKGIGAKEKGEGTGKEENTVREGGSLPGKGERENKLGEETKRKISQGTPQFVPGLSKEEGNIKIEIKGLGKNIPSSIPAVERRGVKKSSEDPLTKEPIPPEYRDTIKLYFERLKGER